MSCRLCFVCTHIIFVITLDLFYAQMQARGSSKLSGNHRQLTKMILVDEADNFLHEGFPSLKKILKEGREFGVGTILSTQFLKHFGSGDDDFSKYILTWVVHNVADLKNTDIRFVFNTEANSAEEAKLFGDVKKLQKHYSIVKMGNHSKPIYIKDKAFWELFLEIQAQDEQAELTTCDGKITLAEKKLEDAYKKLELDIKRRSVSAVSSKVLLLLEDLQVTIFDRLIREVREDTLTEFNRLIRKRKFIDDIQIDEDFRVHLLRKQIVEKKDLVRICRRSGVSGIQRSLRKYAFLQLSERIGNPDEEHFANALESFQGSEFELLMEINKDTLSKGETQVFVMSLYWAMMQQCKCELPFIIDTPFARIDTDHRANIVEQFFKRLPGQLFVLSTNEEISSKHMMSLHDQTSNVFLLEYGDDKRTKIIDNQYFEV